MPAYKFEALNAAGKTTTGRAILQLQRITAGSVRLLGREPAAKGIFEVADMPRLQARLEAAIADDASAAAASDSPDQPRPAPHHAAPRCP